MMLYVDISYIQIILEGMAVKKDDLTNVEHIVERIEQAGEIPLNRIIRAVIHRYNVLHTDRKATFLALSTDPHTRNRELETIMRLLNDESGCRGGSEPPTGDL